MPRLPPRSSQRQKGRGTPHVLRPADGALAAAFASPADNFCRRGVVQTPITKEDSGVYSLRIFSPSIPPFIPVSGNEGTKWRTIHNGRLCHVSSASMRAGDALAFARLSATLFAPGSSVGSASRVVISICVPSWGQPAGAGCCRRQRRRSEPPSPAAVSSSEHPRDARVRERSACGPLRVHAPRARLRLPRAL